MEEHGARGRAEVRADGRTSYQHFLVADRATEYTLESAVVSLIPLAQTDSRLRRVPWVSAGILLLNLVSLVAMAIVRDETPALRRVAEVRAFLRDHPYLRASPEFLNLVDATLREELERSRGVFLASQALPSPSVFEEASRELAEREQRIWKEIARLPDHRWGFVPAAPTLFRALTSMFVHGGWLHLAGNMLFLWVTAPALEEAWGRWGFLALYAASGLAGAGAHALRFSTSEVPLIGASAAVAGLMGSFLVYFAVSRIRFLVFPTPVTVTLPAAAVFPFWLVEQAWFARYASQDADVAFTAHVGGFLFGLGTALVVKAVRPRAGDRPGGITARDVREIEVAYHRALRAGDGTQTGDRAALLLEYHARTGDTEAALALIQETRDNLPAPCPPGFWLAAAAFLGRHDPDAALAMYADVIAEHERDDAAVRALMGRAELLRRTAGAPEALRAYEDAMAHPACTLQMKERIQRALARLER